MASIVLVGEGELVVALRDALEAVEHIVTVASPDGEFIAGRTFDLLLDADALVVAADDADVRYLANDAAAVRGIPMVWIDASAGEVGAAFDEHGVDYRDLRAPSETASAGAAPADALVAGAVELADEILTCPETAGTVRTWDGDAFREQRLSRTGEIRPGSLEERTEIPEPDASRSVTAPQLAKLLAGASTLGVHEPVPMLLDVREDPEVSFVTLPDAVHIPIGRLPERIGELDRDAPIVVYCHHGVRSSRAMAILERAGFTRVRHLTGGIDAYAVQVAPGLPRY